MRYYFAPMEGLTDSIYRFRHRQFFPGVDRYYTPFFSPTQSHKLTCKEQKELPPRQSLNMEVIPQILTKVPEDFLWLAQKCAALGYEEVNLNAGCPSGTVTAKGKGAGMLADPESLDRFLDQVFSRCPIPISVKTRIGFQRPEEFAELLGVYNRYPVKELTVHPRVRKAFYAGTADMEIFAYAAKNSKNPLCYNGDITDKAQALAIGQAFPNVNAVMIGRGLIARPDMLSPREADGQTLLAFYEALLADYMQAFSSSRNAMFRLKEHWHYLAPRFPGCEKLAKRLRKTTDLEEYRAIIKEILLSPVDDNPCKEKI